MNGINTIQNKFFKLKKEKNFSCKTCMFYVNYEMCCFRSLSGQIEH